jgi:GT2 family glycosyltransferase/glycosyltransferase involved in cell wall biosynthesis
MERLIAALKSAGELIFLLIAAPFLLPLVWLLFWFCDWLESLHGKPALPADELPATQAASIVIPTWNGRHHLAANLPSVLAATAGDSAHEVVVVDNGSTDGTVEYLQKHFPSVRVLAFATNLGFGGGSNEGFRAARNDVVVLLNNDMRVEPDFLGPLLKGFSDPRVFAVTAQIFFSDPEKRREETGLAHGLWLNGRLHLRHVIDEKVDRIFPTFYAGGGSTAYDRRKFLELGGFDPLLEPFYYEDTDLSYMAWKRGWVVLYEPHSVVYHEHRGTIGKKFSAGYIQAIVERNQLLFLWKNIHEKGRLASNLFWLYAGFWIRLLTGPSPARPGVRSALRALQLWGRLLEARRRAQQLAVIDDTEAFRRPLGGYFRDRFGAIDPEREKLSVLFVSPYPIEPPLHGGAVFMNQTVRRLARLSDVHLLCLLDEEADLATNLELETVCASAEFVVRWSPSTLGVGGLRPHAAEAFYNEEFGWKLHRTILLRDVDVVQLDYTQLASYWAEFRQLATFLFEHDVYFQSVRRAMGGVGNVKEWVEHAYEYLRALRFERRVLERFDSVQVCTAESRRFLESYVWSGAVIREGLRAGIDVERYRYNVDGREPESLLFVGNFRHPPNIQALDFFVNDVLPGILRERPNAHLTVIGAHAPHGLESRLRRPGVTFLGPVEDIRDPLSRHAVFVCPILSGSGVRVKLLEAFAAGIPAVSTTLGAEGLLEHGSDFLVVADRAEEFAHGVVEMLADPARARDLAERARREVEQHWDMRVLTERLEGHYREVLREKQGRSESSRTLRFPLLPSSSETDADISTKTSLA